MNLLRDVASRMEAVQRCYSIENGVRVNTHCLYPSNGAVQVTVMGAGSSYFVSDAAGAIREAEKAGAHIDHPDRLYSKELKKQGLFMKGGAIFSPSIGIDAVPAAVILVANASKEVADSIFQSWRLAKERNFKALVRNSLRTEFADGDLREEKIVGTSNKPHSFENVVRFMNGAMLLVDPVLRDANSINSRFVANLDVSAAKYPHITQRIVYDDEEDWQTADLSLLAVSGVPLIPFSKAAAALRQAAPHH